MVADDYSGYRASVAVSSAAATASQSSGAEGFITPSTGLLAGLLAVVFAL